MTRINGRITARDEALADLARSGLGEKHFKALRLRALDAEATYAIAKIGVPALELPYLTPTGKATGFARYRFLAPVTPFGSKKELRYWQPKGSAVRAYFPSLIRAWPTILSDAKYELWLTEGEKKAAAACAAGIACVGLGGVWNWKSNKAGLMLIEDLERVAWDGRRVVLAFDADAEPKPEVAAALQALAVELHRRAARVELATLPLIPGATKTGLDDYLVAGKQLDDLPREPVQLALQVARLNDELALIRKPIGLYHSPTGQLVSVRAGLTELYANRTAERLTADGKVKRVPLLDEWLKWPHRREHAGLAYEPGAPRVTAAGELNLWAGWPYEPLAGDVTLWHDLLDHLFGASEEGRAARAWFERWAAYPIQRPGTKLYTCVLFHSKAHGTGKSLAGLSLANLYGVNAVVITEAQLHASFNDWMHKKQFIVGEEVTSTDKRSDAAILNHVITGETMTINAKYQPLYTIRNCANCFFSSNQPDAQSIELDDRRRFVWEVTAGPLPRALAQAYDPWFKSAGGRAALFTYLMSLELGDFDPYAPALATTAKARMAALSGTDADRLARDLIEDPARFLATPEEPLRALYSLDELVVRLEARGYDAPPRVALARALRRAGAIDLDPTKTGVGVTRPWALRDPERWRSASHAARAAALAPVKTETKPRY